MDDEELLAKAEELLTEIKVAQGLSERHEAMLAAPRIRLKGSAGSVNHWDDLMGEVTSEELDVPFDLLLGRQTYEIFVSYWPNAPEEAGGFTVTSTARSP